MVEQPSQAVVIKSEQREITISFNDVKRYLCPLASDAEIGLFLKVCASENLNPFRKDCYLVKYSKDQPASIIIATEVFLRSAENSPDFNGYEAGIILSPIDPKDKPEFREGAFLMDGEEKRLVGGWARVYRKDRARAFYSAINIKECIKYTKYGKPTRFWEEMPATMVRKVALSRVLREAFSNRYSGTYTTAEIEPPPEGELPPALEKNGKPDWKKFWARVKSELGLTTEEARHLLEVNSIKKELIDAGWTMEKIWDELVIALRLQKATEAKHEEAEVKRESKAIDVKADEAWDEITHEAEGVEAEVKKPKRDPGTITTIVQLYHACHEDWGMQPKEVIKELGYSSQTDVSETPAECYRMIAAVRK